MEFVKKISGYFSRISLMASIVVLVIVAGAYVLSNSELVRTFAVELWPNTQPVPNQNIVKTNGKHFVLNGQPYIVKGFMPTAFDVTGTDNTLHSLTLSEGNNWTDIAETGEMWRDFNEQNIAKTFAFWASHGVNTIRLGTPDSQQWQNYIYWHCFEPWYLTATVPAHHVICDWNYPIFSATTDKPGTINPKYRDRLVRMLDIAYQNGIRIDLVLVNDAKEDEWECRESYPKGWSGWKLCTLDDVIRLKNHGENALRFIRPGSQKEAFYFNYLNSLIPYLKDHPGLFSYEISNENLQAWELNGENKEGNEWWQNQVGSFLHRMISRVRQLDPNHMIGTGEVGYMDTQSSYWAYPAGEFGMINDIDNLNNGKPFTLESIADFVGTHLYNYLARMDLAPARVRAARERTQKPIIFGEFNYYDTWPVPEPRTYPTSNPARKKYYEMAFDTMNKDISQGFFIFDPFPAVMSRPANWVLVDNILQDGQPNKGVEITTPPIRRVVHVNVESSLFDGNGPASSYGLKLLDEGVALTNFWKNWTGPTYKPNNAVCVNSNIPSQMTSGKTYPVTITMRNAGTNTWTSSETSYHYLAGAGTDLKPPYVALPLPQVKTDGEVAFSFEITAPTLLDSNVYVQEPEASKIYDLRYRMGQQNVEFFGELCGNPTVKVSPVSYNDMKCISHTIPSNIPAGKQQSVSVTVQNTGKNTWTASGTNYYFLANTDGNTFAAPYVALPTTVAKDQQVTFQFQLTAPTKPGSYPARFKMAQQGLQYFGSLCGQDNVVVF